MLWTLPQTRNLSQAYHLVGIAVFTLLTIVCARITVEIGPVPLTLQTLAVLLSGLVLGARDGAISQIIYVALIATGLPLDARALGVLVFAGPTWGYLIGFIPAAFVAGYLVEHEQPRARQRMLAAGILLLVVLLFLGNLSALTGADPAVTSTDRLLYMSALILMAIGGAVLMLRRDEAFLWQRISAGLVASVCFFVLGVAVLKFNTGLDWSAAISGGFIVFIPEAIAKVVIAAALTEGGRALLMRQNPQV